MEELCWAPRPNGNNIRDKLTVLHLTTRATYFTLQINKLHSQHSFLFKTRIEASKHIVHFVTNRPGGNDKYWSQSHRIIMCIHPVWQVIPHVSLLTFCNMGLWRLSPVEWWNMNFAHNIQSNNCIPSSIVGQSSTCHFSLWSMVLSNYYMHKAHRLKHQ